MKDFGDEKEIISLVDDTYGKYKRRRYNFERIWYRNLLFLMGIQWITFDETERKWRNRRLANWVPTPVTNLFASSGERLVSVLSRVEPNWIFVPGSDSHEDMAAADVADKIEEIISEENNIDQIRELSARWITYTGNAFLVPGVEKKFNQEAMAKIKELKELLETVPPEQAEEINTMMDKVEQQGSEYGLYTDVYSPFEVWADLTIPNIKDQQEVMIVSRKDKDYVKNLYQKDVEVDNDRPETLGLHYLESIAYLTSDLGASDYGYGKDTEIPRTTLKRLYKMPNEDWPEGLYTVVSGSQVLEAEALPKDKGGRQSIPVIHMKFDEVPGAFFGRTPMNDIVPKQTQHNKLESMIELMTLRMSSPIWLLPDGTIVKSFTGEPGAILRYSLVGDKAAKPDRLPGEQIPNSLLEWMKIIKENIEELASTFEALKGQAPYSGAPGIVVEKLIEQGMTRFGPAIRGIAEGYRQWMKMQLELFRMYATTSRALPKLGDNLKWKIEQFSKADFSGAVNVRIESDSTVPRSEQVESARVYAAVNSGLLDISDPMIRLNVLKKIRLGDMMKTMDEDVLSAIKEHEILASVNPEEIQKILMQSQQARMAGLPSPSMPVRVLQFIHNHDVHILKHRFFAMSEEGQPYVDFMMYHITEHNMLKDAEMIPGPGAVPGQAGPESGGASPNIGTQDQATLSPQGVAEGSPVGAGNAV